MKKKECIVIIIFHKKKIKYETIITSAEDHNIVYYQSNEDKNASRITPYFKMLRDDKGLESFKGKIVENSEQCLIIQGEGLYGTNATLKIEKDKISEVTLEWPYEFDIESHPDVKEIR